MEGEVGSLHRTNTWYVTAAKELGVAKRASFGKAGVNPPNIENYHAT